MRIELLAIIQSFWKKRRNIKEKKTCYLSRADGQQVVPTHAYYSRSYFFLCVCALNFIYWRTDIYIYISVCNIYAIELILSLCINIYTQVVVENDDEPSFYDRQFSRSYTVQRKYKKQQQTKTTTTQGYRKICCRISCVAAGSNTTSNMKLINCRVWYIVSMCARFSFLYYYYCI